MTCEKTTQSSNLTAVAIAEVCRNYTDVSPVVWYAGEPNDYSDFGAELTNEARDYINASRQRQKGSIVDLEATAGYSSDLTQNNKTRLMQGVMFADAREKAKTQPFNVSQVAFTGITTGAFQADADLDVFKPNDIILASGMDDSVNNGIAIVTTTTATAVNVSKTLTANASPSATSKIEVCGYQFPAGDIDITASSSSISLTSTVTDFTTLGLTVGETVVLGGDTTTSKFDNTDVLYARVSEITANELSFDDTSKTTTTETGTGKEIQMFFGTVIRNEKDSTLIIPRRYNIERQLGNDGDGIQSEIATLAAPSEYKLTVEQASKINTEITFTAEDVEYRTGVEGLKAGTRVDAFGESAYNSTSDIYRTKISVVDPVTLNPSALFGYTASGTLTINNNISADKAVGFLGAIDMTAGNFEAMWEFSGFFTNVEAQKAIRNNADFAVNMIIAKDNAAMVFDSPLVSASGGKLEISKDESIKIPITGEVVECKNGYSLMYCNLPYAPTAAMPTV